MLTIGARWILKAQNAPLAMKGLECRVVSRELGSVLCMLFQSVLNPYLLIVLIKSLSTYNATYIEATRGVEAQSVTVKPTGCGFDTHSKR